MATLVPSTSYAQQAKQLRALLSWRQKIEKGVKKKKEVNIELGEQGPGGDLRQGDQGKPL